jgi:hypothetical protein
MPAPVDEWAALAEYLRTSVVDEPDDVETASTAVRMDLTDERPHNPGA